MATGGADNPAKIIGVTLAAAVLFVALATLFANLLRPLAPSGGATFAGSSAQAAGAADEEPLFAIDDRGDLLAASEEAAEAAAAPLPEGPLVAIVMTELGTSADAARAAIERLPDDVTFTFTPYADIAPQLAQAAREDGHEVFVSLPMEPQGYPRINPGPNTLLRRAGEAENMEAMEWALGRFDDLDGATGMMGSAFTQDESALRPVMKDLHMRGLVFIDQRASGRSVAERAARESGVPSRTNDRFLDEPATAANIRGNLDALMRRARERGYAIGYARPTSATVEALANIEAQAREAGVTLVGAARLARGLSDDS